MTRRGKRQLLIAVISVVALAMMIGLVYLITEKDQANKDGEKYMYHSESSSFEESSSQSVNDDIQQDVDTDKEESDSDKKPNTDKEEPDSDKKPETDTENKPDTQEKPAVKKPESYAAFAALSKQDQEKLKNELGKKGFNNWLKEVGYDMETYNSKTEEEQQTFRDSFEKPGDFVAWYWTAHDALKAVNG